MVGAVVVVVGVRMATKVGGVNLGLAGVKAGAVPDFQEDLLEVLELRDIQVVLEDMGSNHMKTTSVVLNSKEMVACHLPQVKKKVWEGRVRKVTIIRLKVQPLPLPWLKMQWEVGHRQLGLETGTTKEGMVATRVAGPDLWEATKVDLTQCLLRSARIRRTRQRRSLVNKWVDQQAFLTQLKLKWQRSLLPNRLVAPRRQMLPQEQQLLITLQELKTVKNRKLHLFQELRIGRPALRLLCPSASTRASPPSTRTW